MSHYYPMSTNENRLPDPITLEEMDDTHPRNIITFYNGFNPLTEEDYEVTKYDTNSIYAWLMTVGDNMAFNPMTRVNFDANQIRRIKWYKECVDKYPDLKRTEINETEIIQKYMDEPNEVNTDMFKYLVTYETLIDYLGFHDFNRDKAIEYLADKPYNTFVIRKCSVKDTKYNKFFVLSVKKSYGVTHYLFVHTYGYGIRAVDGDSNCTIKQVQMRASPYYCSASEFYTDFIKKL